MSEDGGYMDGYNDGLIDGREAKPLRWRTGPAEPNHEKELCLILSVSGHYYLDDYGYSVGKDEKYIPLADILALIGGE